MGILILKFKLKHSKWELLVSISTFIFLVILLIINFELTGHDEKTKVLMKENYQKM